MIIVSGIFFILFLVTSFLEGCFIFKISEIKIISYVRLFYSVINFLIPCIICYKLERKEITINLLNNITIENTIIILILTIISYITLSIGYHNKVCCFKNKILKYYNHEIIKNNSIILLILGYIALIIWTSAYGSISNFLAQAARIRSGLGEIQNNYAFFKQFAKYLNLSFMLLGSYFMYSMYYKDKKNSLIMIVAFIASFVGAILFLSCSDSRGSFAISVLVILLCTFYVHCYKKRTNISKQIIYIFLFSCLIFTIAVSLSDFADIVRYGEMVNYHERSYIDKLIEEYSFVMIAQDKVISIIYTNEFEYKLIDDLIGALLSWIPSAYKPVIEPLTLWQYNTLLIKGYQGHGTLPTDMITASIYYFNFLGPIVLPFLLGKIIKYIENTLKKIDDLYVRSFLKAYSIVLLFPLISHFMLRSIVYENISTVVALIYIYNRAVYRVNREEHFEKLNINKL